MHFSINVTIWQFLKERDGEGERDGEKEAEREREMERERERAFVGLLGESFSFVLES